MIAPVVAATPTHTGLMSRVLRDASSAALTRAISPGSGMPRLSRPMIPPTIRYTAIGGIVCRISSTFTPLTMPYAVVPGSNLTVGLPRRTRRGLAGEPIEFAHLLIEGAFGHEAAQLADEAGLRAGGIAKFGFLVGRCCEDRFGDGSWGFALLDSVGDHLLSGLAALVVDPQRVVGLNAVGIETGF